LTGNLLPPTVTTDPGDHGVVGPAGPDHCPL